MLIVRMMGKLRGRHTQQHTPNPNSLTFKSNRQAITQSFVHLLKPSKAPGDTPWGCKIREGKWPVAPWLLQGLARRGRHAVCGSDHAGGTRKGVCLISGKGKLQQGWVALTILQYRGGGCEL